VGEAVSFSTVSTSVDGRSDGATTRLRLDIAYDGTAFAGWAKQPGLRTVQGVLEEAISRVLGNRGRPIVLTVAGRTDAGVHATGQVAHVDLDDWQLTRFSTSQNDPSVTHDPGHMLLRRANGAIGTYADVLIRGARIVPDGFDARFSALWRRYEYRIADSVSVRNPLDRNPVLWLNETLDVDAMQRAADALVGLHDFAAFCKPREGATTIRTLQEFRWRRDEHGELRAHLQADAFCHSMVRALVGGCVAVGLGRIRVSDLLPLFDQQNRAALFPVMPARGLTFVEVGYPDDAELAERAQLTRQRRTLSGLVDDDDDDE